MPERAESRIDIAPAHDMEVVRQLFREYQEFLGVDLCFQGFEEELAALPGKYAPPRGIVLIATREGDVAGCVAMRPLEGDVCEMKRLYLRPDQRGFGIGRMLARAVLDAAVTAGYTTMRLDTLNTLTEAIALYRSLGFAVVDPYYHNPLDGVVYMEKPLP